MPSRINAPNEPPEALSIGIEAPGYRSGKVRHLKFERKEEGRQDAKSELRSLIKIAPCKMCPGAELPPRRGDQWKKKIVNMAENRMGGGDADFNRLSGQVQWVFLKCSLPWGKRWHKESKSEGPNDHTVQKIRW